MDRKRRLVPMTLVALAVLVATIAIASSGGARERADGNSRRIEIQRADSPASPKAGRFIRLLESFIRAYELTMERVEDREEWQRVCAGWIVRVLEKVGDGEPVVMVSIESKLKREVLIRIVGPYEQDAPFRNAAITARETVNALLEQSRRIAPANAKGRR